MLTYTDTEKNTIVNLLSNLIEADGIIHPKEIELMNNIMQDLEYTILDLDQIHEKDFFLNRRLFHLMDDSKQMEVKDLMVKMAGCDGFVDPREQDLIDAL